MPRKPQPFNRPAPPRDSDPWDGVLLIDKPAGPTSHDVVDAIRRSLGIRRVGHGGTLDPGATGLLVILTGRGTKLSNALMGADKVYEGTLRLGISTDSQDADGTVTREADCSAVTRKALEAEMRKLTGDIMQVPPMVSAVKIDGVPLYKRARKGQTVERKPRLVHIYEFSLLSFAPPDAQFVVHCTKGTYVRTLCADIGDSLGCGAHLRALRRTACGELSVNDAIPLETLKTMSRDDVCALIRPVRQFAGGRAG